MATNWAARAASEKAEFWRGREGKCESDAEAWARHDAPEFAAWRLMALAESRDEFYARLGHAAPASKVKRGPSKVVLALTARVAELEAALAEALSMQVEAPIPPSREVVDETRVRDLEAQVRGFLRYGVAS